MSSVGTDIGAAENTVRRSRYEWHASSARNNATEHERNGAAAVFRAPLAVGQRGLLVDALVTAAGHSFGGR